MSRETLVNAVLLLLLPAAALTALALGETFYINLVSRIAIVALAGVGLNLALGAGGLVSFGHAAFFGVGGYAAGIAAHHAFDMSLFLGLLPGTVWMPVIWMTALLSAALLALGIGAISLRTRGVYFIMITLAFAQMTYYFAISLTPYGGEDGLPIYLRNQMPGMNTNDPIQFFALVFGVLLLTLWAMSRVTGSRFGAALDMARLNDVRLASSGISPFPVRLTAFVISAMVTALAGALFADLNGFVGPSMLSWHRSGEIMVIVILGGVGRLFGPVAGAILFILLEVLLGGWTDFWQFWLGLVLLGAVLFARGGLLGLLAGRARHD
ncbi:branched-chain amino acid ABC transporter permease [Oceanomicrobium pacificus]|uniref:branched-chain amino acid ABC transporter permease n=1 Tax=Oceanomicrobium pacificus TaxID=2692916 RepID=UPI001F20625C|nr:branched-chain amino acid ABC transporter permease [Oceanomicrobium pacificus]